MIKEIEVGGVKHSITLADDMVGQGLVKDENGVVGIKTLTDEAKYYNLMSGIVADSDYGLCLNRYFVAIGLAGTGLEVEGDLLRVSTTGLMQDTVFMSGLAYSLAGTGLTAIDGKLMVSGGIGGGSVDAWSLAGSGLRSIEGNKLALALSGSHLLMFGPDGTLDVDLPYVSSGLCGTGLENGGGRLYIALGSGMLFDENKIRIDCYALAGSGLIGDGSVPEFRVNIANRTSGLRLFFNQYGELDVTQN